MIHLAIVEEVLYDRPGLRVRFQDMVRSGASGMDYVRILCGRMSPTGGASMDLPAVGELVAVAEVSGGGYICIGSVPFANKNQADPTEGIAYWRHASGVVLQAREDGSFEVSHPSGLRVTVSPDGEALAPLQATSHPPTGPLPSPAMKITHPAGPEVSIDPDGNGALSGFMSLTFQEGDARFSMEGLADWLFGAFKTWVNLHTHTSASPGSPTTAPVSPLTTPSKDTVCSPAAFKGPQGA